ncbi:hypothetical protein LI291_05060 [Intestinibacillus massiliensis]|nr:hypothetical protein [Intestinibacillus massiliensis]
MRRAETLRQLAAVLLLAAAICGVCRLYAGLRQHENQTLQIAAGRQDVRRIGRRLPSRPAARICTGCPEGARCGCPSHLSVWKVRREQACTVCYRLRRRYQDMRPLLPKRGGAVFFPCPAHML